MSCCLIHSNHLSVGITAYKGSHTGDAPQDLTTAMGTWAAGRFLIGFRKIRVLPPWWGPSFVIVIIIVRVIIIIMIMTINKIIII